MTTEYAEYDAAINMLNNPEEYSVDDIIEVLVIADDLYHNDDGSFLTDAEYDALRLIAHRMNPTHVYFTGTGSAVRGGKIKLPYEMGSLDQVEIGEITEWIGNWNLQNEEVVISDKMDGTSVMMVYNDDGMPQIAYSRGNGTEGADISRHIFNISNVPPQLPSGNKLVVRAEVELTETAFKKLQSKVMSRSGKPYKNARNMVAGLMNAKSNPEIVYDYLTVVAYEIVGADCSKENQLKFLKSEGFQTVDWKTFKGKELSDEMLADYLNNRRQVIDYAIDGVVIDVNSKRKRDEMNPTKETLNPAYSIKYKVADADNMAIATVIEVEWNVSKHGYLKPRVKIEPVELVDVTVQHATGFNAKFIKDNNIGPGAKIRITRSGDVIPFILEVVEPTAADLPVLDYEWDWNETGVDAVIKNHDAHEDVKMEQAIDFFTSIEVPHLREGNIKKLALFTGDDVIGDIIRMDQNELVAIIGENGNKIYEGLHKKLSKMPLYVLAGSVPFFGRGVGKRKFKALLQDLNITEVEQFRQMTVDKICDAEGFKQKTAEKIVNGVERFIEWFDGVADLITIAQTTAPTGSALANEKVVFTGFRDKGLAAQVEQAGGQMQTGVSGKTTILVAKNPNSNSGKMKTARDKGVNVIGIDELKEMIE